MNVPKKLLALIMSTSMFCSVTSIALANTPDNQPARSVVQPLSAVACCVEVTTKDDVDPIVPIGSTLQLVATVTDANGDEIKKPRLSWKSKNSKVATVAKNGLVKAISAGETTITVTCGKVSSEIVVQVKDPYAIDSLEIQEPEDGTELNVNQTITLSVLAYDEDGNEVDLSKSKKKVAWTSSDANVAAVDARGNVKAKRAGDVTITAKIDDVSNTLDLTVVDPNSSSTVEELEIEEPEDGTELEPKQTVYLHVIAYDENGDEIDLSGTNQKVTWSTSNPSVATVDSNGKVTTKSVGDVTITAKIGNVTATLDLIVSNDDDSGVYV
ncbi:Ig-like domain-containing protein [Heliobacterium mobile]|uniref:Ig-like domain-containing protein n=1 Tax=Heliobacterium mobile TaxID=28064 RepID=UPI0014781E74|nr:Ig-like domain-containing protein [Heliobacterium mobile]